MKNGTTRIAACSLAAAIAACSGGGDSTPGGTPTTPALTLSTGTVAFAATQAGGALPGARTVSVTNSGGGTLAAPTLTVTYGGGGATGWLDASVAAQGPGYTITLRPNSTALGATTYDATVEVASAGATGSPKSITVSWQVTANPDPVIAASPATLGFTAQIGAGDPASQSVTVSNGGGGSLGTVEVSDDADWLSASISGATVTVAAALGTLTVGHYTGHVTITSAGAVNSPLSYVVTFDVVQPTIHVTPASLSFAANVGTSPAAQTLTVTNSGTGTLATPSVSDGSGWLTATVSGAAPSYTVSVVVDTTGLAAGSYDATVALTSAGASNSPTVAVTLTLTASTVIDTSTIVTAYEGIMAEYFQRYTECFKASSRLYAFEEIGEYADALGAAQAAGRLTYVRSQADACAAAVSSATCASLDTAACERMWTGLVANGHPCYASDECSNGYCTADQLNCPGACTAFRGTGAICGMDEECGPGKQCVTNGVNRVCTVVQTPGAQGEACAVTSPQCQTGLYCKYDGVSRTYSCVPRRAVGEPCSSDAVCDAALACNMISHTCQERAGVGESCSTAVCGLLLTCSVAAGMTCTEYYPVVGEDCGIYGWCVTGYCDQNLMCVAGTVPVGGTCDGITTFCVDGAHCDHSSGRCVAESVVSVCY